MLIEARNADNVLLVSAAQAAVKKREILEILADETVILSKTGVTPDGRSERLSVIISSGPNFFVWPEGVRDGVETDRKACAILALCEKGSSVGFETEDGVEVRYSV